MLMNVSRMTVGLVGWLLRKKRCLSSAQKFTLPMGFWKMSVKTAQRMADGAQRVVSCARRGGGRMGWLCGREPVSNPLIRLKISQWLQRRAEQVWGAGGGSCWWIQVRAFRVMNIRSVLMSYSCWRGRCECLLAYFIIKSLTIHRLIGLMDSQQWSLILVQYNFLIHFFSEPYLSIDLLLVRGWCVFGHIYIMLRESSVQQQLRSAFPQFSSKQQLIDYYVSFDFPEKQMRMVGWWQRVIDFLIALHSRTYITYQELVTHVTQHNLKPTPLQPILSLLNSRNVFVPQGEMAARAEAERRAQEQQQGKTWYSSFLPFLSKTAKEQTLTAFTFTPGEKIFSKKAKELKKQEIRAVLPAVFGEGGQSMEQFRLSRALEEKVSLDAASVEEALKELQQQGVVALRQRGQKRFVLYSRNAKDLLSSEWSDLQSMKFCLREEILKFQAMISREEEKAGRLHAKAGEQAAAMNKVGAKATLREYLQRGRKVSAMGTRKNVLENQLTQLEYNEMNKSTLSLLEESQKVYQQTLIDASRLDEAIDKTIEQAQYQRETNEKMEQIAQSGQNEEQGQEEDVNSMLEALTMEVQQEKRVERKQVSVELGQERRVEREKEEAMDLE